AWRYRGCDRFFAPTGCGRPLLWAWTLVSRCPTGTRPRRSQGSPRFLGDPLVYMPWADTPEDPRRQANTAPRMLPSVHPTTSAPRFSLSRLITTACTLAVYASKRRVTPTRRKTRFRWVANPCRVGFGPTGSTTKGFRFCLVHFSFLPSQAWPGARGVSGGAMPPPHPRH